MRRTIPYISTALFTFALGFLTVGAASQLTIALPVAFIVFILIKKIAGLRPTLHHLQVAFLTLLIWTPFAAITLYLALPKVGNCEVDFSEEEFNRPVEEENERFIVPVYPRSEEAGDTTFIDRCGMNYEMIDSIWVGVVDNKAISKPAPRRPPRAKASGVEAIVAVSVVIEATTGEVLRARALSGPTFLQQAAVEAAYQARFSPTRMCPMPSYASGILTYRFGL